MSYFVIKGHPVFVPCYRYDQLLQLVFPHWGPAEIGSSRLVFSSGRKKWRQHERREICRWLGHQFRENKPLFDHWSTIAVPVEHIDVELRELLLDWASWTKAAEAIKYDGDDGQGYGLTTSSRVRWFKRATHTVAVSPSNVSKISGTLADCRIHLSSGGVLKLTATGATLVA